MKRWQFKRYFLLRDRSFLWTIIYLRKKFFFTFRLLSIFENILFWNFYLKETLFEVFSLLRDSFKGIFFFLITKVCLSFILNTPLIFIWKICYFALLYLLVREFEYLTLNNALNRGRGGITRMKINFACIINEREISAFKTVSIGTRSIKIYRGYIFHWLIGSKSARRERLFLISEWNKRPEWKWPRSGNISTDWFVTVHSSKDVWNYLKIARLIYEESSIRNQFRLNSLFFLFFSLIN